MSETPLEPRAAGWTACVMAGGRSQRMGRDKSRIIINGISLLDRVKQTAATVCDRVMTIRRDALPNCGPLSGIHTGLLRAGSGWCLFLACDMPLLSTRTLEQLRQQCKAGGEAVFVKSEMGRGFPLALHTRHREQIHQLIENGARSLIQLAEAIPSHTLTLPPERVTELINANTTEELQKLRQLIRSREGR